MNKCASQVQHDIVVCECDLALLADQQKNRRGLFLVASSQGRHVSLMGAIEPCMLRLARHLPSDSVASLGADRGVYSMRQGGTGLSEEAALFSPTFRTILLPVQLVIHTYLHCMTVRFVYAGDGSATWPV